MSSWFRKSVVAAWIVVVCGVAVTPTAQAFEAPGWELSAATFPSNLEEAHEGLASGTIAVDVFNVGAAASKGTITLTDKLPQGLRAREAGSLGDVAHNDENTYFGLKPKIARSGGWDCVGNGPGPSPSVEGASVVTCTNDSEHLEHFAGGGGTPSFTVEPLLPYSQPAVGIAVEVEPGAALGLKEGGEGNRVTIAGGGAPNPASTTNAVTIGPTPAHRGLTQVDSWFSNANGTIDGQAGSHPYEATVVFDVATADKGPEQEYEGAVAGSEIRDLETELPAGYVGDLASLPRCTRGELFSQHCPPGSMVGRLQTLTTVLPVEEQVFNMEPEPGAPAELGFNYGGVPVFISFAVKSGSTDGLVARVENLPEAGVYQGVLTLWGAPGESSHNIWRHGNGGCSQSAMEGSPYDGSNINYCQAHVAVSTPILRLPTSCSSPPVTVVRETHGWQEADATSAVQVPWHNAADQPQGLTGCQDLSNELGFGASPTTAIGDSPTGLTAEVDVPRSGFEQLEELAPADLEGSNVTLPEGLVINPGQAAGLQTCPAGRPGPGRFGNALTTPAEEALGQEDAEAPSCPGGAKVGTVTIKTPLLEADTEKQLEGDVYLLPSNPPELKLLAAVSADGINVKLPAVVRLNEATGRVETTFSHLPQLPFSHFKLEFEGGARAALDTPTRCGTDTIQAAFSSWNDPLSPNWLQDPQFAISEGTGGTACPGAVLPFAPTFAAGSANTRAGAFTSFTTQLTRGDGQQRFEKLSIAAPVGLAGIIADVPTCSEPVAAQGTCAATSRIGHVSVTSGPGSSPLALPQPGAPELPIYLTGPYEGAPFGLSIVTPVIAGPFDLGTIVTRAKVEIDPRTAQVTITTDPLPQIVKGVPTDLRSLDAVIDREDFLFNPTDCEPQAVSATMWGTAPPGQSEPQQTASLSARFGVSSCKELSFTPSVSTSVGGHASRADGASVSFKISYPKNAVGSQSWFEEAKFELPKQISARLETLRKACLQHVFETERQNCPAASKIGTAVVRTPVLPVPLEGKVYFVSYGSAQFPEAVIDLYGDNVHVELHGETFISKKSVTSATFRNTPDVPFESIEVTLPAGQYSEFGAALPRESQDFCGRKLTMPTLLKAQNGLEIRKSVQLTVTGCPKAKAKTRKQKLAGALKTCHKQHGRKRARCEAAARKRYGTARHRKSRR